MTGYPQKPRTLAAACLASAAIMLALIVLLAGAGPVKAQVTVTDPSVTAGDLNSSSTNAADQSVTGLEANLTFEASKIPDKTRARVKTNPDVAAPSVIGGNPCLVGASGGVSAVGFGAALGLGIEDEDCETRQVVALVHNMGQKSAAYMHLCLHNPEFAGTVESMGYSGCSEYVAALQGLAARAPDAGGSVPQVGLTPAATPSPIGAISPGAVAPPPVAASEPVSQNVAALAAGCGDAEYRRLRRSGLSWPEWSPACRARHMAN